MTQFGLCIRHGWTPVLMALVAVAWASLGLVVHAPPPRSLPGPLELPGLGAPEFILKYSLLSEPLGPILLSYRQAYGDIFTVKTGPIRQVWVADEKMVDEIYSLAPCSGRSQLPAAETPFGEKFLFLMRDPQRAQSIREQQRKWLSRNAGTAEVRAAVGTMEPELFACFDAAMAAGSGGGAAWPAAEVGTAILGALLGVFVGEEINECLSVSERAELLSSLAGYRKRANAPPNPFATKLDYAQRVRALLLRSLQRSGRSEEESEELLPLLVSACVGGGEIFPLLLQWTIRRLALEPALQVRSLRTRRCDRHACIHARATASRSSPAPQAEIRTELSSTSKPYGSTIPRIIAAVMRQCPYSLAIGPPRKALTDFEFRGMHVPEGSLVFAMHPGVGRTGPLPTVTLPIHCRYTAVTLRYTALPLYCCYTAVTCTRASVTQARSLPSTSPRATSKERSAPSGCEPPPSPSDRRRRARRRAAPSASGLTRLGTRASDLLRCAPLLAPSVWAHARPSPPPLGRAGSASARARARRRRRRSPSSAPPSPPFSAGTRSPWRERRGRRSCSRTSRTGRCSCRRWRCRSTSRPSEAPPPASAAGLAAVGGHI